MMGAETESEASASRSARLRRARRGRAAGAVAGSVACHVAILAAILLAGPTPPAQVIQPPIAVELVALPPPAPPLPPAPAKAAPPTPPPPQAIVARKPRRVDTPDTLPAESAPPPDPGLSDAELAGAATAGSGGGGGGECDMARRVQDALRKDPLAQAAVARFYGKAIMVWNGDWVWMPGEDGKGLAAVRQAMMWEIAFSPKACRAQQVHGLVVIAAAEGHGGVRLAVGQGEWRWSDLLIPHPEAGGSTP